MTGVLVCSNNQMKEKWKQRKLDLESRDPKRNKLNSSAYRKVDSILSKIKFDEVTQRTEKKSPLNERVEDYTSYKFCYTNI